MLYNYNDKYPEIEEDVFIAPGSRISGKVIIKSRASIWFNAVIRGDVAKITIGKYTNIQENCSLHVDFKQPLLLANNITVGHGAILHGCTVENYCLIGMGATVLNRSRIGKYSIIGAGALVPEDKVIPEKSLVIGVPGKIVRTLTDDEINKIKKSASHYYQLAKEHKESIINK